MNIKDKLDIILITYNRKSCLEETFKQIFADNSPIKDFDITVLDNRSDDGTSELINTYSQKYPNLKHVINKVNIGGCANAAKAIVEIPNKEYAWVLCDNDSYDWTNWNEVEIAIEKGYDFIITQKCENNPSELFYKASFIPAVIFKTSLITTTVAQNLYDYVPLLFPQLALISECINKNSSGYIVKKDIVHAQINPDHNSSFIRGLEKDYLPEPRKNIFWSVGYFSTTELITDKKIRTKIINNTRHFHKTLFDLFKSAMIKNKVFYNNYSYNFYRIFRMLNFKQKIQLIFAFLVINLSFKNYRYYETRSYTDWIDYFNKVDEQKYLDKLAQKYNDKKVLLYGAGMLTKVLLENYNLSKFNIIGVSDKRFERSNEKEFMGLKTILPDDIKNLDYDAILFALKLYKKPAEMLKKAGVNKKMFSLIKKDIKYPIRS